MVRIISTGGMGGYYREGADGIAYDREEETVEEQESKETAKKQAVRKRKPKPPPVVKLPPAKKVQGGYTAKLY